LNDTRKQYEKLYNTSQADLLYWETKFNTLVKNSTISLNALIQEWNNTCPNLVEEISLRGSTVVLKPVSISPTPVAGFNYVMFAPHPDFYPYKMNSTAVIVQKAGLYEVNIRFAVNLDNLFYGRTIVAGPTSIQGDYFDLNSLPKGPQNGLYSSSTTFKYQVEEGASISIGAELPSSKLIGDYVAWMSMYVTFLRS